MFNTKLFGRALLFNQRPMRFVEFASHYSEAQIQSVSQTSTKNNRAQQEEGSKSKNSVCLVFRQNYFEHLCLSRHDDHVLQGYSEIRVTSVEIINVYELTMIFEYFNDSYGEKIKSLVYKLGLHTVIWIFVYFVINCKYGELDIGESL